MSTNRNEEHKKQFRERLRVSGHPRLFIQKHSVFKWRSWSRSQLLS